MPLSPENRARLLVATREAAAAFHDDIDYLRQIDNRDDVSRGEIRRISGTLRRLLVDRDLALVASPRIGRLMLLAPDNKPVYKMSTTEPPLFFASGRGNVFGWKGAVLARYVDRSTLFQDPESSMPPGFSDLKTVELRLDNFLSQRVLCYYGNWVSRKDVIKYVANVASGIHSKTPETDEDVLSSKIRNAVLYRIKEGGIHIALFPSEMQRDESRFRYTADALDPVLVELLATARFLAISPDIDALERFIREELF